MAKPDVVKKGRGTDSCLLNSVYLQWCITLLYMVRIRYSIVGIAICDFLFFPRFI